MTMEVLPVIRLPSASKTSFSDAESRPADGSSRMRIGASRMMARAMAMRCRCPPESVTPRPPIMVS